MTPQLIAKIRGSEKHPREGFRHQGSTINGANGGLQIRVICAWIKPAPNLAVRIAPLPSVPPPRQDRPTESTKTPRLVVGAQSRLSKNTPLFSSTRIGCLGGCL